MNRTVLALAALSIVAAGASADVFEFAMSDHPAGNQAPPFYGLRVDNLFGNGRVNTFSIDWVSDSTITITEDGDDISILMEGTLYGGPDIGFTTGGAALFTYSFEYTEGVVKTADGWRVLGMSEDNGGTLTAVDSNFSTTFTTKANHSGVAFIFETDGHRIGGDHDTWVGRGWVSSEGNPRSGFTQDWLFTADVIPAPGTLVLAASGGLLVVRRRRKS